jgi:hypothetical protein
MSARRMRGPPDALAQLYSAWVIFLRSRRHRAIAAAPVSHALSSQSESAMSPLARLHRGHILELHGIDGDATALSQSAEAIESAEPLHARINRTSREEGSIQPIAPGPSASFRPTR